MGHTRWSHSVLQHTQQKRVYRICTMWHVTSYFFVLHFDTRWKRMILLMEVILHHLGCIKPCKYWDIYHINWCRISAINSMSSMFILTIPRDGATYTVPAMTQSSCYQVESGDSCRRSLFATSLGTWVTMTKQIARAYPRDSSGFRLQDKDVICICLRQLLWGVRVGTLMTWRRVRRF